MIANRQRAYRIAQLRMRRFFIVFVALIIVFALFLTVLIGFTLNKLGWFNKVVILSSWLTVSVQLILVSTIIGSVLTTLTSKMMFKPVNVVLSGIEKLSKGQYQTRIDLEDSKYLSTIADGLNGLAQELENVEILRSDFINNFSHEFKTPIVSIKGLISLLKRPDISDEKRQEYIAIIEDELNRLSMLTTNVLNLSKLEMQNILTDVGQFNLSEQIRTCVLMLEKHWTEKALDVAIDGEETMFFGNEDMLKQVWINLLDNAIKFASDNGKLKVEIASQGNDVVVSVANTGQEISPEHKEKIFNKFYQADTSHTKSGNGIGLSIVKRIVDLHNGSIAVDRKDDMTVFSVTLPKVVQ